MNVSISTPNVETNLLNAKRFVLTTAILLVFSAMHAQRFSVQSFRQLPNDISAYIQPVKDLNDEACALIKIVGSRDFVFSTPLGVVKRKTMLEKHGYTFHAVLHKSPSNTRNGAYFAIIASLLP